MITLDSVTKVYADRGKHVTAVDGVSLTVDSGEIFGILGRSGAGKTTLLRCLNLLERPTSGTITVDGVELVVHFDPPADPQRCDLDGGELYQRDDDKASNWVHHGPARTRDRSSTRIPASGAVMRRASSTAAGRRAPHERR